MRVIAGSVRGRRLVVPPGDRVRPTADRVREAAFNALGSLDAVEGARVLDLFAGTGALGIEALSRGAEHATFVERDRTALQALAENLEATDLVDCSEVVRADALAYVRSVPELLPHPPPEAETSGAARPAGHRWDLALLDPPYAFDGWPDLLDRLPADLALLESGGPVALPPDWTVVREKAYGTTVVTIARRTGPVRPSEPTPTT